MTGKVIPALISLSGVRNGSYLASLQGPVKEVLVFFCQKGAMGSNCSLWAMNGWKHFSYTLCKLGRTTLPVIARKTQFLKNKVDGIQELEWL